MFSMNNSLYNCYHIKYRKIDESNVVNKPLTQVVMKRNLMMGDSMFNIFIEVNGIKINDLFIFTNNQYIHCKTKRNLSEFMKSHDVEYDENIKII